MGNFEDTKPSTKEEKLKECVEFLEETRFNFACFVDAFKSFLIKSGFLEKQ